MRVLGRTVEGNPIVEVEAHDREAIGNAVLVLRKVIVVCAEEAFGAVAPAEKPGQKAPATRAAATTRKPRTEKKRTEKPPAKDDDKQAPNAACAKCKAPFRRRTSEKQCPACRGVAKQTGAAPKVTVIPPKRVKPVASQPPVDPLARVAGLAEQARREDHGE
jgi:rubrerythrin